MSTAQNVHSHELDKFAQMAPRWWDPEGECKPLHRLNPVRLQFIIDNAGSLADKRVLDVGCGGGILSEAVAREGATVTAIDATPSTVNVAKLHLLESGLKVDYRCTTIEQFRESTTESFDVITCMEMLEHVPDPLSVIASCAALLRPGGHFFLSTINRTPKAFALAIVGAEYVLRMLPKGTHSYKEFIRPSELSQWARAEALQLRSIRGVIYNPVFGEFSLSDDVDVNYLAHFQK